MRRIKCFFSVCIGVTFLAVFLVLLCRMDVSAVLDIRQGIEQYFTSRMPFRYKQFELYGSYNKFQGRRSFCVEGAETAKLDNGSLINSSARCDIAFQGENIMLLDDLCKSQGIDFLYVNYPSKSAYEKEVVPTGIDCYSDQNADDLLFLLTDNGVATLDMRNHFPGSMNQYFYKTDHHWTVPSGLRAAQIIASYLKQKGYKVDVEFIGDDRMTFRRYEDAWLGETGRKLSLAYSGTDDFVKVEPDYPTQYTVRSLTGVLGEGDFVSVLINESLYPQGTGEVSLLNSQRFYNNTTLHYSYLPLGTHQVKICNNENPTGPKILMIKDSFSVVVAPFLSLVSCEVTLYDMRDKRIPVKELINSDEFDIVIVAYFQDAISRELMFDFQIG